MNSKLQIFRHLRDSGLEYITVEDIEPLIEGESPLAKRKLAHRHLIRLQAIGLLQRVAHGVYTIRPVAELRKLHGSEA